MVNVKTFLVVIMLLASTAVSAARFPAYYPDVFPRQGMVDRVDLAEQVIVINDSMYLLSDRVVTHTVSSEFDTLDKVGRGSAIGFKLVGEANARPLVTEIWVLPGALERSSE